MRLLTLNSVLVATDLGESSWPAIRTAARLAPLAGASLHLLHVATQDASDAESRLTEHFLRAAPDAAEPDSVRVMLGPPAAAIAEHALQVSADVVVLGPHRRQASGGPLGGTAMSVVRAAPCPCLVAAAELRLPLERVLVPVDVAQGASGALLLGLSWASALRKQGGRTELVAMHVTERADDAAASEGLRTLVVRAQEDARGAARVDVRERVIAGQDPAEEILREAASSSADLLVMATRGADRDGLGARQRVERGLARDAVPPAAVPPSRPARA